VFLSSQFLLAGIVPNPPQMVCRSLKNLWENEDAEEKVEYLLSLFAFYTKAITTCWCSFCKSCSLQRLVPILLGFLKNRTVWCIKPGK